MFSTTGFLTVACHINTAKNGVDKVHKMYMEMKDTQKLLKLKGPVTISLKYIASMFSNF